MNLLYLLIILLAVFMALCGDLILKYTGFKHVFLVMVIYALSVFPAMAVFRMKDYGTAVLIWSGAGLALGTLTSRFICGEPLTTRKCVALVLVSVSIWLANK